AGVGGAFRVVAAGCGLVAQASKLNRVLRSRCTNRVGPSKFRYAVDFDTRPRRMSSALFSSFSLRNLALANRIVVSPMCQYSAVDGCATDWHVIHWGQMLQSSAAMFTIEATAVSAIGRITYGCL